MARRELTGAALTARQLKKELTRVFPGVKFSVKSEYFSGGNAVNISWEDGPTKRLVESYTEKYKNSKFDGMTDSTIAVKISPELGCEGANYIGMARSLSRAREIAIKKMIAKMGERERSAAFYEERHPEIWPDAYRQMWREYETVRALPLRPRQNGVNAKKPRRRLFRSGRIWKRHGKRKNLPNFAGEFGRQSKTCLSKTFIFSRPQWPAETRKRPIGLFSSAKSKR